MNAHQSPGTIIANSNRKVEFLNLWVGVYTYDKLGFDSSDEKDGSQVDMAYRQPCVAGSYPSSAEVS